MAAVLLFVIHKPHLAAKIPRKLEEVPCLAIPPSLAIATSSRIRRSPSGCTEGSKLTGRHESCVRPVLGPASVLFFAMRRELHTTTDLSETIRSALRESDYLIVVCSPQSQSEWVNAEIAYFRKIGRGDRILPLLIEGTPETAFPQALLDIGVDGVVVEPLAADIRPTPTAFRQKLWPFDRFTRALLEHWSMWRQYRHRRKLALLRILAPILECRFDDLRQREAERTRRRRRAVAVAAAAILFIGGGVIHNSLQTEIFELTTYSRDSLRFDPSRMRASQQNGL